MRGLRLPHFNINKFKEMKKYIETFEDFNESINGTQATPMNTPGMGNAVPPGVDKVGSADSWGSDDEEDDDKEKQRRKKRRIDIDDDKSNK